MCMNWEEKGALGVRYLLKYIENPNSAYLDVVKDNINEIKFFSYLNFFVIIWMSYIPQFQNYY